MLCGAQRLLLIIHRMVRPQTPLHPSGIHTGFVTAVPYVDIAFVIIAGLSCVHGCTASNQY
jgi:hypothetical protein